MSRCRKDPAGSSVGINGLGPTTPRRCESRRCGFASKMLVKFEEYRARVRPVAPSV